MAKILLVSILLVVVYQFDELAHAARVVLDRLSGRRTPRLVAETDHYVGTALTIACLPLLLNLIFVSEQELPVKLALVAGAYLIFAVLATGVGVFARRLRHRRHYNGVTMAFSAVSLVGTLFHPSLGMVPWHAGRERATYAKLAFLLSLPVLLGLAFQSMYGTGYREEFSAYLDMLVVVMIGGSFMYIVINFLERYFKSHRVSVSGYFRVALGLGVALLLLA